MFVEKQSTCYNTQDRNTDRIYVKSVDGNFSPCVPLPYFTIRYSSTHSEVIKPHSDMSLQRKIEAGWTTRIVCEMEKKEFSMAVMLGIIRSGHGAAQGLTFCKPAGCCCWCHEQLSSYKTLWKRGRVARFLFSCVSRDFQWHLENMMHNEVYKKRRLILLHCLPQSLIHPSVFPGTFLVRELVFSRFWDTKRYFNVFSSFIVGCFIFQTTNNLSINPILIIRILSAHFDSPDLFLHL